MDKFTGAFNSFAGGDDGNNNNRQQQQQYSQGQAQGRDQGNYPGGFPEGNQETRQGHSNNSGGGAGGFLGSLGFGGGNTQQGQQGQGQTQGQSSSGGFLGGLGEKLNSAAGGGRESEKNEDYLDKAVDFAQERFLGQGPQDNESAVEQAKDEQISDYIRKQYKSTTGTDFPIKDKETRFG